MAGPSQNPAQNPPRAGGACDLVSTPWACAIWCLCGAAFFSGFSLDRWRPYLWIGSLGVAGVLCVTNAVRCHRLHCYITGPVFLAGALLTALNAADITHIPWNRLGWGVIIGAAAGIAVEIFGGKYPSSGALPPGSASK